MYVYDFNYYDLNILELVEGENPLLMEYLKSESICTYTEWLEKMLLTQRATI
jgi:predicted nucleotidyltransferase